FGNTILDDMEGRIRVSVVATGIDAAEHKLPEKVQPKVQPIRPHIKTVFAKSPPDARFEPKPEPKPEVMPAMQANPVHRQHEALAEGLTATAVARNTAVEPDPIVLGEEEDTRTLDEKYPVTVTVRPIPQHRPEYGTVARTG